MPPTDHSVDEHEIARRAYELFMARGGEHGHDFEDWLHAKQELSSAQG